MSKRHVIDKAADFGRVAVLMGGISPEREISLMTGKAVLGALRRRGIDAHGMDAADDLARALLRARSWITPRRSIVSTRST